MQLGLRLSLFFFVCNCLLLFVIDCHCMSLFAIDCDCFNVRERKEASSAIGSGKELICVE